MKIRKFQSVNDDVYAIKLDTEDWSQNDTQLMQKYGEPEIDVGGIFSGPPAFSLPSDLVKIASDSPFVQSFDARDELTEAAEKAIIWKDIVSERISEAVTDLRENTDTFTKEEVETI